jgi:hypothetical protein
MNNTSAKIKKLQEDSKIYLEIISDQKREIAANKLTDKKLQMAMEYGMGYVVGKHNMSDISKEERDKLFTTFKKDLVNGKIK